MDSEWNTFLIAAAVVIAGQAMVQWFHVRRLRRAVEPTLRRDLTLAGGAKAHVDNLILNNRELFFLFGVGAFVVTVALSVIRGDCMYVVLWFGVIASNPLLNAAPLQFAISACQTNRPLWKGTYPVSLGLGVASVPSAVGALIGVLISLDAVGFGAVPITLIFFWAGIGGSSWWRRAYERLLQVYPWDEESYG